MGNLIRIGIIGGGISGLTTAFYLQKLRQKTGVEIDISLLEAKERLGGVIRSERVDGFLLETGPEAWASYKLSVKELVRDLDLEAEQIGSNDQRRRTFVLRNGELEALPDGMTFFAPVDPISFWRTAPLSWRGKLRASFEPFISRSQGDLSVRTFFERRLGSEFTDQMVEPLLSAIYGADLNRLSAPSTMPELYGAEQRRGSLWSGLRRFAKMTSSVSVLVTLREGMVRLVEKLTEELDRTDVHLGVSDLRLSLRDSRFEVKGNGAQSSYDRIVFCTPAGVTSSLLRDTLPETAGPLNEIPYSSSRIVYLGYKRSEFSHPLNGFGFVVPSNEAGTIDACTWVTTKFDGRCPDDKILLRCAIHGARKERCFSGDEEVLERVHKQLAEVMGFSCNPIFGRVYNVGTVIPQLLVGHKQRLEGMRQSLKQHPTVYLAGSYCGGVGVPDCIKTGKETAEKVMRDIQNR